MSPNSLTAKIIADTEVIVAEIKSAAQVEVDAINKQTEEKMSALGASYKIAQQKKQDHMELVAVSRAKQEGNIAIQTAKRQQIDSIINGLKTELINQSSDEYVNFFTKFAKEAIDEKVVMTSIEVPANRESETKKIMEAFGLSGEVVVNSRISAGFILHTMDGVYDVTLDRILNGKRPELEMKIIQQVMG